MCLSKISKQSVGNEGKMWKVYFRTKSDDVMYSLYREDVVMTDCWMLNKEPKTECRCGVREKSTLDKIKENFSKQDASVYDKLLILYGSSGSSNCYEHGFHGWKTEIRAIKNKYNFLDGWVERACEAGELEVVIKEVFYKGYIAEDDDQIVSRQIYVPEVTDSPNDESRIYDILEKEYIGV